MSFKNSLTDAAGSSDGACPWVGAPGREHPPGGQASPFQHLGQRPGAIWRTGRAAQSHRGAAPAAENGKNSTLI